MLARDQAELIVVSLSHPDRQGVSGDPDTPGELQASLGVKRYGEHEDAGPEQEHELHDQLQERLEVAAFDRVVEFRRPGIQANLDRDLRNRERRDQPQTAPVHPFVLRRPEGQGKKEETPEKLPVMAHPLLGTVSVVQLVRLHERGSPGLAEQANPRLSYQCLSPNRRSFRAYPTPKARGQPTERRTRASCCLLSRKPDRHAGIRE